MHKNQKKRSPSKLHRGNLSREHRLAEMLPDERSQTFGQCQGPEEGTPCRAGDDGWPALLTPYTTGTARRKNGTLRLKRGPKCDACFIIRTRVCKNEYTNYHRSQVVANMAYHGSNHVAICNAEYNRLVTNVNEPLQCTHCNAVVVEKMGSPLSLSIDRKFEEIKSYDPADGQENHVTCLFCQRGLKGVPWELRQQFHKEASVYVSAGLFDPAASLEVRMEQLRTIHEKENIALVPRKQVELKMNGKWRSHRYIIREKKINKGNMATKDFVVQFQNQYQRCLYTAVRLQLDTTALMVFSPDRIDSSLSYDRGNVQFVLLRINTGKNVFDDKIIGQHLASLYA
jgi:hypothetical protein